MSVHDNYFTHASERQDSVKSPDVGQGDLTFDVGTRFGRKVVSYPHLFLHVMFCSKGTPDDEGHSLSIYLFLSLHKGLSF